MCLAPKSTGLAMLYCHSHYLRAHCQRVAGELMSSASPGSLVEMQNLSCTSDLLNQNLCCNKMPREFRHSTLKQEKPVFQGTHFLSPPQPVYSYSHRRGLHPRLTKQPQSKCTWSLAPLSFATRLLGVIVVLAALAVTFKIITT